MFYLTEILETEFSPQNNSARAALKLRATLVNQCTNAYIDFQNGVGKLTCESGGGKTARGGQLSQ